MKFRLSDADPRHLSARPFLCLLAGVGAFGVSGWFLTMDIGPRWAWGLVCVAALVAILAGVMAARTELRDRDDSQESGT